MKTSLSLAMTALCAMIVATGQASIDTTKRDIRFSGDGARAEFFVVDTTSCSLGTVTRIYVQSSTWTADLNGGPAYGGNTAITISVRDYCVNAEVALLVGSTTQQELQVDPSLHSGSLRSTLPVWDSSVGAFVDVSIDLFWSGMGKIYRDRSGFNDHYENGMFFSKSYETSRDAVATGSLIVGGVVRTLPPSDTARLGTDSHRETSILRY